MAITLPLPVRIAAGVLATGLERLRQLPQDLPSLPVTVAGEAVRISMRVQQGIAELAGRGDELLAGITSTPTERPTWARFDDEDDADPAERTVDGTVDPSQEEPSTGAEPTGPADLDGSVTAESTSPDGSVTAESTSPDGSVTAGPAAPADMPGYDELRLTQVRARLRGLDPSAVTRLLAYERAGAARASFLTLLTNRLTTLQADDPRDIDA